MLIHYINYKCVYINICFQIKNKRNFTFLWFLIFIGGWPYLSWSHFTIWCRLQINIRHIYLIQIIINYKCCIFHILQCCMYIQIHVYLKEGKITSNKWTKSVTAYTELCWKENMLFNKHRSNTMLLQNFYNIFTMRAAPSWWY